MSIRYASSAGTQAKSHFLIRGRTAGSVLYVPQLLTSGRIVIPDQDFAISRTASVLWNMVGGTGAGNNLFYGNDSTSSRGYLGVRVPDGFRSVYPLPCLGTDCVQYGSLPARLIVAYESGKIEEDTLRIRTADITKSYLNICAWQAVYWGGKSESSVSRLVSDLMVRFSDISRLTYSDRSWDTTLDSKFVSSDPSYYSRSSYQTDGFPSPQSTISSMYFNGLSVRKSTAKTYLHILPPVIMSLVERDNLAAYTRIGWSVIVEEAASAKFPVVN